MSVQHCKNCGLSYQCICHQIPKLNSDTLISLLMHTNEYRRETNTGKWLLKSLPYCCDYVWSRVEANTELLQRVNNEENLSFLIYPGEESISLHQALALAKQENKRPHYIILDATWQEAKKMERKSPWLNQVQRVHLTPEQLSCYQLRRNQTEGHLCTLEVASELLKAQGEQNHAEALTLFFNHFMQAYQADKSGHHL